MKDKVIKLMLKRGFSETETVDAVAKFFDEAVRSYPDAKSSGIVSYIMWANVNH